MAKMSRRNLLRGAAAATLLGAFPGVRSVAMPGLFDDYRALVCVFLFGGNDAWNMLVPRSNAEYAVYANSRQNQAIEQSALLPITPLTQDGVQYGLHPAMPGVQMLFESGRLAFVNNVGPLIEATTREAFFAGSANLPPQLFSHNDQQDQWHSLKGREQSRTGWAGRIADMISTQVSEQRLATNVSLFGSSLFQSGEETVAYVMGPNGPIRFEGFGGNGFELEQRRAVERILDASPDSVYARAYAAVQRRAIATVDIVSDTLSAQPPPATPFPDSLLGQQLATVARLIKAREELGMRRQICFVAVGGFDTHDDQINLQPGLLGGVSEALAAFYDATVELGVAHQVTTFTQSDFGRTLTSNGTGTDHGWGGIQMVMGDAVAGRDCYGQYPLLAIDGPDDIGGGRLIPTTSSDQYAATLARWFGIDEADLAAVAPHIDNFVQRDLGFML